MFSEWKNPKVIAGCIKPLIQELPEQYYAPFYLFLGFISHIGCGIYYHPPQLSIFIMWQCYRNWRAEKSRFMIESEGRLTDYV